MGIRLNVKKDMSKEEEIVIIEKLQAVFEENNDNYLSSFFSPKLTGWLSNKIRDDVLCSVDYYLDGSHDFENDKEVSKLRNIIQDQDSTIAHQEATASANEALIKRLQEEKEDLQNQITMSIRNLDDSELNEAMLAREIESLKTEIAFLKAKLYDLTNKE